jgi:hypothetical protein
MKRMVDRGFTEIELRQMLDKPRSIRRSPEVGRWQIESRLGRRRWHIIVEPDPATRLVVVITAFAVD